MLMVKLVYILVNNTMTVLLFLAIKALNAGEYLTIVESKYGY